MASTTARTLLQHALPLVKSYGFSREALSLAALSLPRPHTEPLSDEAVSALFGEGEDARRTLIAAWLEKGREEMGNATERTIGGSLKARLRWNTPVLKDLPEAFAILASPTNGIPPLDPIPVLSHYGKISERACEIAKDESIGTDWYARRGAVAAAYTAAELHQLASPETAEEFLDEMLQSTGSMEGVIKGTAQYAEFIARSWVGIAKSTGAL